MGKTKEVYLVMQNELLKCVQITVCIITLLICNMNTRFEGAKRVNLDALKSDWKDVRSLC